MTYSADPGLDEELPQPAGQATRTRRLRVDIVVAVLVLSGSVLVARAVSHGGHTVTPTSVPTSPHNVSLADTGIALPVRRTAHPERCPDGFACVTATTVAAPVEDALHAAFPGAAIDGAKTVRLYVEGGLALWYLSIHAWIDGDEFALQLRARRASDAKSESVMQYGAHSITRYEASLQEYQVIVDYVAPAGHPQRVDPLARLAGDVRLLASQ
jgi:hypothetical protein